MYAKSEGLGVVNYKDFPLNTSARRYISCRENWDICEIYIMQRKLGYLLDSGNILNMFEIQKY